jgi:CRP/FNR family transcriptional regulator, anaerobic regulatory protein
MSHPSPLAAGRPHTRHRSASPVHCQACTLRCRSSFRGLSTSELQFVSEMKCCDVAVAAGEAVFAEGQSNRFVYTLYDGWAVRTLTLANGTRQILDFVLPGDLIGVAGYLLGSSPHSVRALTSLRLCALKAARLPALFRTEPALAMALMAARAQEQQRVDTRLALLGQLAASERIGYLLLELRSRLRERGLFEGQSCRFPVQRIELADAAGLSRAHLMRALRELRVHGLAQLAGGVLTIPDARKLARFSGYSFARAGEQYPIL